MNPVQLFGSVVERTTRRSPVRARSLLTCAYSAVVLKGRLTPQGSVLSAQDRCNGAIASMIVEGMRHPERACVVNIFMPCELLYAMGITPMFPEGISVYVACTSCAETFCESAESQGIPESFCSYHKLMLGMESTGVLPAPAFIANTTLACDANQVSFRSFAAHADSPHFTLDVPQDFTQENVDYVASQLRQMARQLEEAFHTTLDMAKLREICRRSQRTLAKARLFASRRASCTLPMTLTSELCLLVCTHVLLGTQAAETYLDDLLATQASLPRNPAASTGSPEAPRIFWIHTLPNWQRSMGQIFDGARSAELVGNDMAYDTLHLADELDPSDPFDFMARRLVGNTSNGPASRRVEAALEMAQEAGAYGAVVFGHWGCKQTLGMAGLAEKAFDEAGIPLLVLNGDGCDPRNAADGPMVTRAQAFLESLSH